MKLYAVVCRTGPVGGRHAEDVHVDGVYVTAREALEQEDADCFMGLARDFTVRRVDVCPFELSTECLWEVLAGLTRLGGGPSRVEPEAQTSAAREWVEG